MAESEMKILQICHRIPYPPIDGGNIAMMNMALALKEAGHEVHQFALNTSKHYVDPDTIPRPLKEKLHFHSFKIDTKIKGSGLLKNLFTSESYNIVRFFNREIENELINILRKNNFDIVQLETLFTTPYISCIRKNSSAKIVLRAHNVEHIIWHRLSLKEINPVKKKYLKFLAGRLKKYELDTLRDIDALIPITPVDENTFRQFHFQRPILTLPLSIDVSDYSFNPETETEMCLFHLGSMDWMPNVEGVEWFLDHCWQKIHKIFPALKLYLAGRSFPDFIRNENHPNVICEGRIENAHEYMLKKQVMIVPLHSGSGMRVKIIQGMALGKTIISTSIGAEGIPAEHEKNILIADSPEVCISLVKRCVENPLWCRQIGINARKFAVENYSNAAVGHQLGIFYNALKKLN
jgi:glycosyltransferase involved in cell wall biosynthesis